VSQQPPQPQQPYGPPPGGPPPGGPPYQNWKPSGPPPQPPHKTPAWIWWVAGIFGGFILLVIIGAIIGAAIGAGDDDDDGDEISAETDTTVEDTDDTEAEPEETSAATEGTEPEPETTTTEEPTTTTEEPTTTTEAPEIGTRTNPIPVGTPFDVGPWTITVVGFTENANDIVAGANQFNDPPRDGHQFTIVNLQATFNGGEDEPTTFAFNVRVGFLGSSSVQVDGSAGFDAYCGVTGLEDQSSQDVFAGGTVNVPICYQMTPEDAASMVVVIEEGIVDRNTVFAAVR
jgi:hypothetical protein